jgi:hypothetical protein
MYKPTIRLFDTDDSAYATAASLTPDEAVRHAFDLSNADLLMLSDEALDAVVRIRPVRVVRPEPRPQAC